VREFTIEITDYCPFKCPFCSTNATDVREKATWMTGMRALRLLREGHEACTFHEFIHLEGWKP
jgi:2-iminoacetate synthase ThiH